MKRKSIVQARAKYERATKALEVARDAYLTARTEYDEICKTKE